MPKLDITKPELVWPGKYDDEGNRVINRGAALPFQVVETIREGRATREPGNTADLFSYAKPSDGDNWKNKLIWGDNLLVMQSLLEQFAGKVDLIYIDPPFGTGSDFSFKVMVGDDDEPLPGKDPSIVEERAYRDTWGKGLDSYLAMIAPRLALMRDLLADTGSIFVHVDVHIGPYIKVILDEIFGKENFQNEIAWYYYNKMHDSRKRLLPKAFDQILYYVKSKEAAYTFNRMTEPRDAPVMQLKRVKVGGRMVNARDDEGNIIYQEKTDRTVDTVWRIRCLQPANKAEWVHYETQKPVDLIERVLALASNEGDLVLDCFCGSGSSLVASERNGRRWIGCDLGRFAVHTTRKRLLDIPGCKPFEILNLGQYERKYWQGVNFGDQKPAEPDAAAIAAYVRFILDLYRAQPVAGTHIHGRKGGALVHVGAVDAPVTIREVNDAVAECAAMRQKELHLLGWEWEMGLHDPLAQSALREHGVRLRLLNIPREVMESRAVEAGDIRFFDLAHLEAELEQDAKHPRKVKVKLKNFVIPDTDLIPDEVRDKIRKWSDYIDYWAVDWDFKHDTFMNAWQTYRTRQNRKLALVGDTHEYRAAGRYQVLIKVVDIFGNDTSRLLECKVK
jgi:adenine-specific DNA-methyltransferase